MPHILTYTHTSLETNGMYKYRVIAVNFNGQSIPSNEFTFNACLAPRGMSPPVRLYTSAVNALHIEWTDPESDGGCPVSGFAVYRDDGNWGLVNTEVNTASDPAVRGNPILRQLTVTDFPADMEG